MFEIVKRSPFIEAVCVKNKVYDHFKELFLHRARRRILHRKKVPNSSIREDDFLRRRLCKRGAEEREDETRPETRHCQEEN